MIVKKCPKCGCNISYKGHVKRLYKKGFNMREIAKNLKISLGSVHTIIKEGTTAKGDE